MKIEIINQNQMRVLLKPQELRAREISASDMFNQSNNKVQELFKEITETLQLEYGFATLGTPLMFEATLSDGGFNVLVTRVVGNTNLTEMQKTMMENLMGNAYNAPANAAPMQSVGYKDYAARQKRPVRRVKRQPSEYTVFTFDNIDDAAKACSFSPDAYIGNSRLYKKDGKYVLLIANKGQELQKNFERKLGEFGIKEDVTRITMPQLQERAEVIIQLDAVNKLKSYDCL